MATLELRRDPDGLRTVLRDGRDLLVLEALGLPRKDAWNVRYAPDNGRLSGCQIANAIDFGEALAMAEAIAGMPDPLVGLTSAETVASLALQAHLEAPQTHQPEEGRMSEAKKKVFCDLFVGLRDARTGIERFQRKSDWEKRNLSHLHRLLDGWEDRVGDQINSLEGDSGE